MQYCVHCGKKINVTRDELAVSLSQTIEAEREAYTRYYIRAFLAFAIFIFIVAFTFFIATRYTPSLDIEPAFPFASPSKQAIEGSDATSIETPVDMLPIQQKNIIADMPDVSEPVQKNK